MASRTKPLTSFFWIGVMFEKSRSPASTGPLTAGPLNTASSGAIARTGSHRRVIVVLLLPWVEGALQAPSQRPFQLALADRADLRLRPSVGQTDVVGEDVLVVDQPVLRRVGVGVAGVGPDWMRPGRLGGYEP